MSIRTLIMAFLLAWGGTASVSAASEWEEVKVGSRSYVTLDSFARFYQLNIPTIPEDGFFELRGNGVVVALRPLNREAYLNGKKVWLSFAMGSDDKGRVLVPKADVILLFDPLIRAGRAVPPRPFKGVVIDPGHGGADKGAQTAGLYTEKAATLDTALRLETKLKAAGIPTIMTRRTDVFITLEERAAIAARYPGHVFVSIHYNAGPRHSHGVETFALSPQGTPSTSSEGVLRTSDYESHPGNRSNLHNILMTGLIHREMSKMHSPAGDRGVKRARFVVLRENSLPAVLVEGGFMSNRTDAALITTGAYRDKLADAILQGLKSYVREVDPTHAWIRPPASGPESESLLKPARPAPAVPLRKPEEIQPSPSSPGIKPIPAPTPAPTPTPAPVVTPPPIPATPVPTAPQPPQPAPPATPVPPTPDPAPPSTAPEIETTPPPGPPPEADPVPEKETPPPAPPAESPVPPARLKPES